MLRWPSLMTGKKNKIAKAPCGDHGTSLVEYGLILGVVAAVAIPGIQNLGEEISDLINGTADAVSIASVTVSPDPDNPFDPSAFVFEVSSGTGAIFPSAGGIIEIDWGDETANSTCTTSYVVDPGVPLICNYPSPGTYQISITGDLTGYGQMYSSGYKSDITRMIQWGDTGLTDLSYALYGATNLTEVPLDLPGGVQKLDQMFAYATSFNDPAVSVWNTSNVSSMVGVFRGASAFNQDLDDWNMSNVNSTEEMFLRAASFDQDLNSWDTSQVTSMKRMFRETPFNGDISNWDVSKVWTMQAMFRSAPDFNRDLSNWDVHNVLHFHRAFYKASDFNQDISSWDVSRATTFDSMFYDAVAFNSDVSNWDVSGANQFTNMFNKADSFASDLSDWNMSSAVTANGMFYAATSFDSDLSGWDVSGIVGMDGMFRYTSSFTGDLSSWCVSSFASPPANFSEGSAMAAEPVWGSCL